MVDQPPTILDPLNERKPLLINEGERERKKMRKGGEREKTERIIN